MKITFQLLNYLTLDIFRLARPLFEDFKLKWGSDTYISAKPSDSIYPASSALDVLAYVEHGDTVENGSLISDENFVQYAPRRDGEIEEEDFRSFFGGNVYHDRKIGSKTVAYRVTPSSSSSSSSSTMDDTEGIMDELGKENKKKDQAQMRYKRRMSW